MIEVPVGAGKDKKEEEERRSLSLCYYSEFKDVEVTGGGTWSPGEQVTVQGMIKFDQFGLWNNVPGGTTVTLALAGHTYTATTTSLVTEETFTFSFAVPDLPFGNYEATLSYPGAGSVWELDCISPCTYSFEVTVTGQGKGGSSPPPSQEPSNVSVTVTPSSTPVGSPVTVTAEVTYSNGSPATDESVSFSVNGVSVGSATTNASGIADVSFTPQQAGTYTAHAWLTSDPSVSGSATFAATSAASTPGPTGCTGNGQCPQGYTCVNGTCQQCNGLIVNGTCISAADIALAAGGLAVLVAAVALASR